MASLFIMCVLSRWTVSRYYCLRTEYLLRDRMTEYLNYLKIDYLGIDYLGIDYLRIII